MSGNKLFVDTNILLYFLSGDQEVIEMISDKDLVISFITELEPGHGGCCPFLKFLPIQKRR